MPIATPHTTIEILRRHNIRLTKRLGQHFLVDRNILDKEIRAADLTLDDEVLEIGPGIGTLTEALASRVRRIAAIELDPRFVTILKETLTPFSNVEVVPGDVLKLDIGSLLKTDSCKLVSNLPYNIATPAITRILEAYPQVSLMVVMVQREIADRLTAKPGEKDYCVLTLKTQYYSEAEQIAQVSRRAFIPEPKVDSAIVRIKRLPKPRVEVTQEKAFFDLVQAIFGQRRKTLRAALAQTGIFPQEKVSQTLKHLERKGVTGSSRAETLTLSQLALLFDSLRAERR